MIKKLYANVLHGHKIFRKIFLSLSDQQAASQSQSCTSYPLATARAFALLALWSVPISTAFTNFSITLFAVAALLSPEVWRNARHLLRHAVSLAAILLILALAFSLLYSAEPISEGIVRLTKYRKLIFIPLLILVFQGADLAETARRGLFASLTVVLLLSTMNYLGLTALGPLYSATDPEKHAWLFKNRITAGLFSALLFNLAASQAAATQRTGVKIACYGVAGLAFVNVFVMLQGRTGQIIVLLLLFYQVLHFAWRHRSQGFFFMATRLLAFTLPCVVLLGLSMKTQNNRLMQIHTEISNYQQHSMITSSGLRLDWYRRSLTLFAERPILGYGVGAVQKEFDALVQGQTNAQASTTVNPHNQYLLLAVELGLVGLILMINLLFQIVRAAARLDAPARELLGSWLFIFALGSLVNSLLVDFSEGHLFVLLTGILLGCAAKTSAPTQTNQQILAS